MNEEEIKIKYILPWLTQAGVDPDEIQLEQSFSVKIGRQNIPISVSSGKIKNYSPRLDILVRRGTKNLLIVEAKASDFVLVQRDLDLTLL